jgi:hypothetical protein
MSSRTSRCISSAPHRHLLNAGAPPPLADRAGRHGYPPPARLPSFPLQGECPWGPLRPLCPLRTPPEAQAIATPQSADHWAGHHGETPVPPLFEFRPPSLSKSSVSPPMRSPRPPFLSPPPDRAPRCSNRRRRELPAPPVHLARGWRSSWLFCI